MKRTIEVIVDRKANEVILNFTRSSVTQSITIDIATAYLLATDINKELDRTNPLLKESE